MRVAVLTGNLGRFERETVPVPQELPASVSCETFAFTEANWPRRINMSPRLQARILKVLGWQLVPGFDRYVWVDGQFVMARPDAVAWMLAQLDGHDMCFYQHPSRHSIHEEVAWIHQQMPRSRRLMVRYTGEFVDEQMAVIEADTDFVDDRLFAAGLGAYKNTPTVQAMMKEWWYHISRYHNNDQIQLPWLAWKFGIDLHGIEGNVFGDPRFVWTRGKYHP